MSTTSEAVPPVGAAATAGLAEQVLERLAALEARVMDAVLARRATDPNPDDPMRGLYVTEAHLLRQSGDGRAFAFPSGAPPPLAPGLLASLAERSGLDAVDVEVLLAVVAPDIDPRFERSYGYLHDDVTRRRASIGLALTLAGCSLTDPGARRRLGPDGRLVRLGFVTLEDVDRPVLTRGLRAPDRVVAALLGDPGPDPELDAVRLAAVPVESPLVEGVARAIAGGTRLVYFQERPGGSGRNVAAAALAAAGLACLCLDLDQLVPGADALPLVRAAHRDALLIDAGLVAGPVDALVERDLAAFRALATGAATVLLTGTTRWDPQWCPVVPLVLEPAAPMAAQRADLWRAQLEVEERELDAGEATAAFRLGPDQIVRAARAARLRALFAGRPVDADDLRSGARSQNSAGLQRLARRIEPSAGWAELVLPPETYTLLRELTARVRFREPVLDGWGLRRGGGRGEGVTSLFAGPSGTGKTLAAEVIAHDLGLDLYTVDLATVVDKYIGETEKNLDRIFNEAERVNGVLFFDEADALFGKRSEVKDARDRYANVEVAYLLQRMERFDGLAVLATNLRANLDEAFARRLDVLADFPEPDEEHRRKLWAHCLRRDVPTAEDVDLDFLARSFELSGGHIRNIVLTAAFLAAEEKTAVTMTHLVKGVQREYRKLGRLTVESEFGRWYEAARSL